MSEQSNNTDPEYSMENDPLFQQISDAKKKKIDDAVEKQIRSLTLDENVDTDSTKVPGQNYALISVVSPQGNQKCDNICLKIKGVFNNVDDANKHAEMLQKIDSTFDIYVVEMYSWLLVPPDPSLMEQKHIDSKLNEIIGGHRESQLKAKMYFEERKRELIENITIENEQRKEENEKLKEEETEETEITEVTEESKPVGINAESSINITSNMPDGANCPNNSPMSSNNQETSASDLMESMINEPVVEKPSKSWADSAEE